MITYAPVPTFAACIDADFVFTCEIIGRAAHLRRLSEHVDTMRRNLSYSGECLQDARDALDEAVDNYGQDKDALAKAEAALADFEASV